MGNSYCALEVLIGHRVCNDVDGNGPRVEPRVGDAIGGRVAPPPQCWGGGDEPLASVRGNEPGITEFYVRRLDPEKRHSVGCSPMPCAHHWHSVGCSPMPCAYQWHSVGCSPIPGAYHWSCRLNVSDALQWHRCASERLRER